MKNKLLLSLGAAAILSSALIVGTANAAIMTRQRPAVRGTVATVSGNILTVNQNGTTYTIDATNATVTKINGTGTPQTITIASIAIGDTVSVMGTVSGNAVAATTVRDGIGSMMYGSASGQAWQKPVVRGSVTAINGMILSVTNASSTVYSVDATNATVTKINSTSTPQSITVANIAVGDTVSVMGTISGNAVTATSIRDGVMTPWTDNENVTMDKNSKIVKKTVLRKTVTKESVNTQTYVNGTLLRGSNKKIYAIVNGKKQSLNTLQELAKYSGRKIINVSDSVLTRY
jgi:hypothetical protein